VAGLTAPLSWRVLRQDLGGPWSAVHAGERADETLGKHGGFDKACDDVVSDESARAETPAGSAGM
jgi:hypothetical protein